MCSFNAGRKTSTRRNSRIDSKKFLLPVGGSLLAWENKAGKISKHQNRRHQRHQHLIGHHQRADEMKQRMRQHVIEWIALR